MLLVAMFLGVSSALPFYDSYDYCRELRQNTTLREFNFEKYLGTWYELYRTPSFYFESGCECTTATYEVDSHEGLRSVVRGGSIRVENSCIRSSILHGERRDTSIGKATIVGPASLEVSFGLPITSAYDVIYVDDKYQYAVVVSCNDILLFNNLYIWVLSRHKDGALDVEAMTEVAKRLTDVGLGAEWTELSQTNQTNCQYTKSVVYDARVCPNDSTAESTPPPCFEGYTLLDNKMIGVAGIADIHGLTHLPEPLSAILSETYDINAPYVFQNNQTYV